MKIQNESLRKFLLDTDANELDWWAIQKHHEFLPKKGRMFFCWLVIRHIAECGNDGTLDRKYVEELLNEMVEVATKMARMKDTD
tara:strand:+ start:331 stop:582 length:252 start_codon:yes stop_codon:yes gene_type:complete